MEQQLANQVSVRLYALIERWKTSTSPAGKTFALMHLAQVADRLDTAENIPGLNSLELAERFMATAQSHADTDSMPQRYAVVAYDSMGSVLGKEIFRCLSNQLGEDGLVAGETEPPTDIGLRKQSQRYIEVAMRTGFKLVQQQTAALERQNRVLAEEATMMREQQAAVTSMHMKLAGLFAEAQGNAEDRKVAMVAAVADEERKQQLWNLLVGLAPVVLAHMSGATPLADFLKSIGKEKLAKMANDLTPEQFEQLKRLLKQAGDAKEATQAATEAMVPAALRTPQGGADGPS